VTLAQWRSSGLRFEHRGHEIFYRDEGRGDVVLCIHGFPTASWDWHHIWPELVRDRRVIAADMIGFGFSAKPHRYGYSIADQADLHEALLTKLGVDRCHVLAHDYGDTVAQELLARHNDRARAGASGVGLLDVCLLNGGLFPETHRARRVQKLLAVPVLGMLLSRLTDRDRFARGFAAVFGPETKPSAAEMDDFWSLVSFHNGHYNSHRLIRYMEERRRHRERWVGALVNSTVPLRLINGPADPVSGRHMAERYRALVADAEVVMLDAHIGHYPQVEDSAAVLTAYREFLNRR
jgi:pimeloyl-ACP methyl ester carboxylesterase